MRKLFLIIDFLSLVFSYTFSQDMEIKAYKESAFLYKYAIEGNLKEVKKLLDEGADPNHDNRYIALYTLSQLSYSANRLEISKLLIEKGANVNAKGPGGKSILWSSIVYKSDNVPFELLVKKGADINAQDDTGATILISELADLVDVSQHIGHIGNMAPEDLTDEDLMSETVYNYKRGDFLKILNKVLFYADFKYNFKLVDNEGHSIYYYIERLPKDVQALINLELDKFKLFKKHKEFFEKETKEALDNKLIPNLIDIVNEYVGFDI